MTDQTITRRESIADAAVQLIAESGTKGLSHRAIDRKLELPDGSVSYYFRTRAALIDCAIEAITRRAHIAFTQAAPQPGGKDAAQTIADYLDDMLTNRTPDAWARYALLTEVAGDPERLSSLRDCLFSERDAQTLMQMLGSTDTRSDAADLISLCEGMVFDHITGRRKNAGRRDTMARSLERFLRMIGLR